MTSTKNQGKAGQKSWEQEMQEKQARRTRLLAILRARYARLSITGEDTSEVEHQLREMGVKP